MLSSYSVHNKPKDKRTLRFQVYLYSIIVIKRKTKLMAITVTIKQYSEKV